MKKLSSIEVDDFKGTCLSVVIKSGKIISVEAPEPFAAKETRKQYIEGGKKLLKGKSEDYISWSVGQYIAEWTQGNARNNNAIQLVRECNQGLKYEITDTFSIPKGTLLLSIK